MFETTSENSIKDPASDQPHNIESPLSLPLIPSKSKPQVSAPSPISSKQNIVLPSIKENQPPNCWKSQKQLSAKGYKNTFVRDVEAKIQKALGGLKNDSQNLIVESCDSDDLDFELQVHRNRELIKGYRNKKEKKSEAHIPSGKSVKTPFQPKKNIYRNQSLYEKQNKSNKSHDKDSKESKSKRKKILKEKSKETKSKKSLKVQKQQKQSKKKQLKFAPPLVLSNHQSPQKSPFLENQNISLFQGLHRFLDNPKKTEGKQQPLVGLSLLKAKRDIEEKIKDIDAKINKEDARAVGDEQRKKSYKTVEVLDKQFNDKDVLFSESRFDAQISRIRVLQQKNQLCMQKYIGYKKQLIGLEKKGQKQQESQAHKQASSS